MAIINTPSYWFIIPANWMTVKGQRGRWSEDKNVIKSHADHSQKPAKVQRPRRKLGL
jgi:hypothetical protein